MNIDGFEFDASQAAEKAMLIYLDSTFYYLSEICDLPGLPKTTRIRIFPGRHPEKAHFVRDL